MDISGVRALILDQTIDSIFSFLPRSEAEDSFSIRLRVSLSYGGLSGPSSIRFSEVAS